MTTAEKEIQEILTSFTVSQLQALQLSTRRTGDPELNVNKDRLISVLRSSAKFSELALATHRLETLTPHKHLYLCATPKLQYGEITARLSKAYGSLAESYSAVDLAKQDIQPQTCLFDASRNRIYLKFVHAVDTVQWVKTDADTKKKRHFRVRHPIVVAFRLAEQTASITFPGFTHGLAFHKEQRLTYPKIAQQIVDVVREAAGIELQPLGLKSAVETLTQQSPNEVINVRRTMKPFGVRMVVDTAGSEVDDVLKFLQEYFRSIGISLSRSDARKLVTQAEADDILLLWAKFDVATRISLFDFGSEILFLWRSGGVSSTTVDEILTQLWTALGSTKAEIDAARLYIEGLQLGALVRPSTLIQQFALSYPQSMQLLHASTQRGLLDTRFRIRTDRQIHDYKNDWKSSLQELPKHVVDEEGDAIEVLPPSIEIAFERIGKVQ